MNTRFFSALATGALFASMLAGQNKGKAVPAAACDRACLEAYVDQYMDAMIAHDPKKLVFSRAVKFTENGQKLELGDGLWNTMSGKGTYRLFITDPVTGEVTFFGSIMEENTPAMLALRLKIENRQISEVETFIQRSPSSAQGFERIGYKWTETIPPAERMSR